MNKYCIFTLAYLCMSISLTAQNKDWIKTFSKDGKTKVDYTVYYIEDEAGKKKQILEYKAEKKTNATIDQCVTLMKNVALHTQFLTDAKESRLIDQISDNEWTVYYYFNAIWPLSDYDSATKVTQKYINENEVQITSTAALNVIEDKGVGRLQINESIYTFTKVDDKTTNIKLWVKVQPTIQAPKWLIKTQFPKLPAGIMQKMAALAAEM